MWTIVPIFICLLAIVLIDRSEWYKKIAPSVEKGRRGSIAAEALATLAVSGVVAGVVALYEYLVF